MGSPWSSDRRGSPSSFENDTKNSWNRATGRMEVEDSASTSGRRLNSINQEEQGREEDMAEPRLGQSPLAKEEEGDTTSSSWNGKPANSSFHHHPFAPPTPRSPLQQQQQQQTAVKHEEEDGRLATPNSKPAPSKRTYTNGSSNTEIDPFLNFDLPDDKKPKLAAKKEEEEEEAADQDDRDDGKVRTKSRSGSSTPVQTRQGSEEKVRKAGQPVSIAHLPVAEKEAMSTFEELKYSWYQNKQMGLTYQQDDSYVCECRYDPDNDDPEDACGPYSGCINRMTQIECLASECRCGKDCQNQRFKKRQYAPIEIVQTEKKGFGMRAKEDIPAESFIYEYVGEVINEKTFQKRMKDYFDEGIRHFYFMMLQKEQYIDATKKGGKGRFLNHSCAPNCYVAKWVVGQHFRMGIFAKRDIEANEELTFNYNVDRYGHDAQECYCGEPNCVGFIGGKTQTELAGMDDLLLNALGITDEVEKMQLKGTKKKKSKKLGEDFNPTLSPMAEEDVPVVASAIRQATSNRSVVIKLLERINMTEDQRIQKQLMRLHGFSLMSTVLHEFDTDDEIILQVLSTLSRWPLIARNKLVSTNIDTLVKGISERENATVADPAKALLETWECLQMGYRIPKSWADGLNPGQKMKREADEAAAALFAKRQRASQEADEAAGHAMLNPSPPVTTALPAPRRPALPLPVVRPAPPNWEVIPSPLNTDGSVSLGYSYKCTLTNTISREFPSPQMIAAEEEKYRLAKIIDVNDIIAKARAEAEAQAKAAAEKAALEKANEAALRESNLQAKQAKKAQKQSLSKEKKMYKVFGKIVVSTMSRYREHFKEDQFKRRAKEVCDVLCEKEKKSAHFSKETYDSVSPEMEKKLKKFVQEFIQKLLLRKGIKVGSSSRSTSSKAGTAQRPPAGTPQSNSSKTSASVTTPDQRGNDGDNVDMDLEEDADNEYNEDLINSLVDGAPGSSATPDSAKTPQMFVQ